jgi:hypothetical protein
MKTFIFLLAILLGASACFAGTGLAFLEIPVGARESALGGAGAAIVTGPTSVTYNPALAAFMNRSVAMMIERHFADTRGEFVGFTLRHGAWALSPHYLGTRVSDIELRDQASRDPIATFDAVNAGVGTAVAYNFLQHYAVGITGDYLYQKISDATVDGWALDFGGAARDVVRGLTVGLAAQHIGKMHKMVSEAPRLPQTLRFGAAYEHAVSSYGTLMVTAEAQGVNKNTPQFKGGIEYRAPGYAALRAGWVEGLDAQNLSLGGGFFVKYFRLDYAFIPYRENLGDGHRFSLTFDI